jgi:hypothetical protein
MSNISKVVIHSASTITLNKNNDHELLRARGGVVSGRETVFGTTDMKILPALFYLNALGAWKVGGSG